MNKIGAAIVGLLVIFTSCKKEEKIELKKGHWLGTMEVSESQQLPFEFIINQNEEGGYVMRVYNAEEVVTIDEFTFNGDSIDIRMPIFEGHIAGTYTATEITGQFIRDALLELEENGWLEKSKDNWRPYDYKDSTNQNEETRGPKQQYFVRRLRNLQVSHLEDMFRSVQTKHWN